jgi:hypothetical protein
VRLLRSPLLHFLAIGGLIFAIQGATSRRPDLDSERVVRVPAAEVERIAREARGLTGRPATPRELALRIREWVNEELLVREARAARWHRSDPVVQRRLVANLRFLGAAEDADPEQLLARAYALGMDRSDPVVRRRLVERARLAVAAAARQAEPSDADLAALLAREPERFRRPARVRLAQVFLSRDRRGDGLEPAAHQVLTELREDAVAPEAAAARGDPFLLPTELPLWSEEALAARLGPDFARGALATPEGRWSGPVASSYGLHLVWVHEHRPAKLPALDEARRELRAAWLAERERLALRNTLAPGRAAPV